MFAYLRRFSEARHPLPAVSYPEGNLAREEEAGKSNTEIPKFGKRGKETVKRIGIIFGLTALMLVAAVAQQPPATSSPPAPQVAQPPQLSELEQANLKVLQLEIKDLHRDIQDYTVLFEAAHPGWSINVITGQMFQKPPAAKLEPPKKEVKPALTPKK